MNKIYKKLYVHTQYGDHLCVFEQDEKSGFIVTVPGLHGVVTWGRNITHAKEMAKEAIQLCIECRAEETIQHTKTHMPRRSISPTKNKGGQKTREPVVA